MPTKSKSNSSNSVIRNIHSSFRDSMTRLRDLDISTTLEGGKAAYRPVVRGTNGAVTSGHHLSTMAGYETLRKCKSLGMFLFG